MLNPKPSLKTTLHALAYLAPLLIITVLFTVWPLLSAVRLSLATRSNFYTGRVTAYGWANFGALWHDPDFHRAVQHTLLFTLGVVPASVLLALGVALLLNRLPHCARFFQTLYFLPFVTSTVAVSLVWGWLFQADHGVVNGLLHTNIDWLNDPHYSLLALILLCLWQSLGFNTLLFLAGLNHIDDRYLLVAQLSGATAWQRFWHVTWPLLTPTVILITVNALITNFKVFDQVYALFHGSAGPANADLTLTYYLYQKFYIENQTGLAAASGLVLFGLVLLITGLAGGYFHHWTRWLRKDTR
ncbi:carbohydrate ABC transporter permease [Levilactobacillus spicheri]|uniref:carbohydrate ABC transporter permease n=1 Tax=Levilactobacillus spicheri TaxID=216463 RepID=UPI0005F8948F|nr:sugar ABC transporter permease [Levilactobacillus spicheri]